MMSFFLRWLLLSIFLFGFTQVVAKTPAQAIATVATYAQSGATVPILSDYEDAGVVNVGTHNLSGINAKVLEHTYAEVDSTVEIQVVVDDYNQMIAAVLTIITSHILSSEETAVEIPTLTVTPATQTTDNNVTIEVNAEAGNKVYVDGVEVGVVDENGTVTITIPLNHGDNELIITVKDEAGNESEPLVIHINSNVPPVANNNSISISEDIGLDVNVTTNDSDVDGDTLTVTAVTASSHGTTSINANGTINYIPNLNYNGSDSFDYTLSDGNGGEDNATVTVTINSVNDAPVGVEDNVTTAEDTMISIAVLANDTDIENDTLSVTNIVNPSHGSVNLNGNNIEYTPTANYFGTDSFSYTPNDGTVDGNVVTVTITVTSVNDIPVANEQNVTVDEDTANNSIVLSGTDIDGDALTYTIKAQPTHGTLVGSVPNISYTPIADYNGSDSFTFAVHDGTVESGVVTVNITVTAVNDTPIAHEQNITVDEDTTSNSITLLGSDVEGDALTYSIGTQPSHGTLAGLAPNVSYTPITNYNGVDSFTFTVHDGTVASTVATVSITVTPVNDMPVANNNSISISEDIGLDVNVTTNDSDVDGDTLTVTAVTASSHGTTSINANGTINYIPNLNYNGADSFDYTLSDGNGGEDNATVTVTINAVNDAPVGVEDNVTTAEDSIISIAVLTNDTDIENDTLSVTNIVNPSHGSVNLNGNNIEYTPTANYFGTDSFSYTPNDGTVDGNVVTVTITVTSVNDIPVANEQNVTVDEDTINNPITLVGSDIESGVVTYTIATQPSHGTVSLIGAVASYTPTTNYFGTDSFTFVVNDGIIDSLPATVNIVVVDIAEPNIPPVANAGVDKMVVMGSTVTITGTATDSDGTIASVSWKKPNNTEIATSLSFTYTPTFVGTEVLTFTVTDNNGSTHNDTMTVTITEQAPVLADPMAQVYKKHEAITALSFSNTGGVVTACSVIPVLPIGLSLAVNNSTCEITGTPTVVSEDTNYTITGTNGTGSETAIVSITISPNLIINEISSAYYTNDNRWFEIYNPTATTIDISDYTLKSRSYDGSTADTFEFSFPSKSIPSGGYLIVRSNYGPAYGITLADVENDEVMYLKDTASNKYPMWFSDEDGFLEIVKNGHTIDFVTIGLAHTPTTASAWTGAFIPSFTTNATEFWKSVARDINSTDTDSASDWVVREFPTYAGLNDVTCNDDVDQDGIPDCSEVSGSTYAGMDLYAFGARTNQKDIFIEVDYMDSTNGGVLAVDEGVIPRQEALDNVKTAFSDNNFTVHFDVGDLFAQNGATLDPSQMDLGGGNEVPYALSVTLGSGAATNVRDFKADNMQTSRKQIFYYMLFGTSQNTNGSSGSSGVAEKPGNDSLMTLGGWGLNTSTVENTYRLINYQAGTVMHEFGHNLDLGHGGDEDKNYKPNYFSMMNYLYQLSGLSTIGANEGDRYYANKGGGCPNTALTNPANGDPRNFQLDYSNGTGNSLDEVNGIDEADGLRRTGSGTIDYNCDGDVGDVLVNFNANEDYDAVYDTLTDHNDWAALNIIFARTYSGNSGISLTSNKSKTMIPNPIFNDVQPVADEYYFNIPSHN